jgi:hypothetical protein
MTDRRRRLLLLGLLGGGGVAPAWTPAGLPGLQLWLDAADSSTLFQDSAGTVAATDADDPVGRWADKSIQARHATQTTTANKPILQLNQLNGLPGVKGNGSSHYLEWTGAAKDMIRNAAFIYLFGVVNPETTTLNPALLGISTSGNAARTLFSIHANSVTANRISPGFRREHLDGITIITSSEDHAAAPIVISLIGRPSTVERDVIYRQNGVQRANGNYEDSGNIEDISPNAAVLFSFGASYSPGRWHELIIATPDTELDAATIEQVETHLNNKWAVWS